MFRPRLYQLETEEELFEYFSTHAGLVQEGVYGCAGLMANDTATLYKKLIETWKDDIIVKAQELLEDVE